MLNGGVMSQPVSSSGGNHPVSVTGGGPSRRNFLLACAAFGLGALGANIALHSCGKKKEKTVAPVADFPRAYADRLLALLRDVHARELPAIEKAAHLAIQAKLEGYELYARMTGGLWTGEMSDTRPGSPLIYLKGDIKNAVRYDFVVTNDPYSVTGFSERLVRVIGISKPSILNNTTPAGALENMGTFRLEDVADIVIYSHVAPADGLLEAPGLDYPVGPVSGIVETFLFYALTVEIAEGLISQGIYPRIG